MPAFLAILAALFLVALPARAADCDGRNLLTTLSAEREAALEAAVAVQPFAQGNYWRATRPGAEGQEEVHLIGTYHLDDPRHASTLASVTPVLRRAAILLVEASPEEQAALKQAIARSPELMFITDGPTLPERLPEAEWQAVAAAMRTRGIPPFMAAKFQPWYLSVVLGMPVCSIQTQAQPLGLDAQLMDVALAAGLPIRSLERYDTVFKLFEGMAEDKQLAMIRSTMLLEGQGNDYAVTLADAYFAGDSRRVWEYLRITSRDIPGYTAAQADEEFAAMEEMLISARNRAWIPVIEAAAKEGPVFAAFGALHLAGTEGVLRLLEQRGFTIEALPP